jgi:hypothetical protein
MALVKSYASISGLAPTLATAKGSCDQGKVIPRCTTHADAANDLSLFGTVLETASALRSFHLFGASFTFCVYFCTDYKPLSRSCSLG